MKTFYLTAHDVLNELMFVIFQWRDIYLILKSQPDGIVAFFIVPDLLTLSRVKSSVA